MVLASFLGDSLALGVHWIYDQARIAAQYPDLSGLIAPDPAGYHPSKQRGAFTHYGDQTLVLLESVAACGRFDPAHFQVSWRRLFTDSHIYVDNATRTTLERQNQGWPVEQAGSASHDLAGAARVAPLVYTLRRDVEALAAAARAQTAMTHQLPAVVDAAECFARAAHAVLFGLPPVEALQLALEKRFPDSPLHDWFAEGLTLAGQDSVAAIAAYGQSCDISGAFQGVVHLVATYSSDLPGALLASTRAGGDSAARNLLVGLLLGASLGIEALPSTWLADLLARNHIESLLQKIDDKL